MELKRHVGATIPKFPQKRKAMLTRIELTTARLFLQHAHASVLWVATMFYMDGNAGAAARLNDIAARLNDQMADIDTLLKSVKP